MVSDKALALTRDHRCRDNEATDSVMFLEGADDVDRDSGSPECLDLGMARGLLPQPDSFLLVHVRFSF